MNLLASGKKASKNPRKTAGVISSLLNIASWFTASPDAYIVSAEASLFHKIWPADPSLNLSQERRLFQVFE
jgi:hypothetical protein